MSKYRPYINLGPGDHLKAEMEEKGWNLKDLADVLNVSEDQANRLLMSDAQLTINVAKSLSQAFGQSPEFWINLATISQDREQEALKKAT